MTQSRKYANLPDLDSAPDIYETPELTDDASTLRLTSFNCQTSTAARSPSPESSDAGNNPAIIRNRLEPDQARTHFLPSRVDARDVDFSDRISRNRQSYRTASRKRRGSRYSDAELGDFSDEEDETAERKLARLRREVEELKLDFESRQQEDQSDSNVKETGLEPDDADPAETIKKISDTLDAIYLQRQGGVKGAEAQLERTLKKFSTTQISGSDAPRPQPPDSEDNVKTKAELLAMRQQQGVTLMKVSDFDARLSKLETTLGLNGVNMPDVADNPPEPILHTLENLGRQLSMVSGTSSIDEGSRRVRQLIQESERLQEVRRAGLAREQTRSAENGSEESQLDSDDSESMSKIMALYGTLPTIDALSPTLPMILERLRTLRLIHTTAGAASSSLDEIEKRQDEQADEIRRWRESLDKVESNMKDGESVLTENVKVVQEWVQNLESRVAKMG
ncbi:Dynamitin-domain-containing protein [Lineolata rhizophorae]|uniref:Dynamitin-domain-containing protein n=1 Tax=Lineolata rhizophorae TaxID=578093 RepID=A0A6A6P953_9PEZI|nr:Dynamitin-domain-containing protein [Lineolata rhizophorae]